MRICGGNQMNGSSLRGSWVMDQFLQRVSGRDQRPIDRFWRVLVKPPSMVPIKMDMRKYIPTLIAYKCPSQWLAVGRTRSFTVTPELRCCEINQLSKCLIEPAIHQYVWPCVAIWVMTVESIVPLLVEKKRKKAPQCWYSETTDHRPTVPVIKLNGPRVIKVMVSK